MNTGFKTLGSSFFISSETQTAVDDFLCLAWNTLESLLRSVETQTRPEPSQYPTSTKWILHVEPNLTLVCILRKWRKGPTVLPILNVVDYYQLHSLSFFAFRT